MADESLHREAEADPDAFWERIASGLTWFKKWTALRGESSWFPGAETNITTNAIDRHVVGPNKNKAALIWEGAFGGRTILTYQLLHREVCRFANGLWMLGVRPSECVTIFLPSIPELVVAMLACARIGAAHQVLTPDADLRTRIGTADSKIIVTADSGNHRGETVLYKNRIDDAIEGLARIENVVVLERTGARISMTPERDVTWEQLLAEQRVDCPAEPIDGGQPLLLVAPSVESKPPRAVLHTIAGTMVGAWASSKWALDIRDNDTYWCTAGADSIEFQCFAVYGPLLAGATTVLVEDSSRPWTVIETYRVNVLYTSLTAAAVDSVGNHDRSSVRLIAYFGGTHDALADRFRKEVIHNRGPVLDTWTQPESGMILLAGGRPLPGLRAAVTDTGSLEMPESGPATAEEFLGAPGEFRRMFRPSGPFVTGVQASRDQEGYIRTDAGRA